MNEAERQLGWASIGVCPDWHCDERLWHAGLSSDGTKCFISGFEEHVYIVWDIHAKLVIWRDDGTDGESEIPPLDEWIDADGYIELQDGPAKGRYRIFGLNIGHPRIESADHKRLEANATNGKVLVKDMHTECILCQLEFEVLSGDWAFASFSDDDSTIAVLEPYSVSFFARI